MKLFNRESINDIINDWADILTSITIAGPLKMMSLNDSKTSKAFHIYRHFNCIVLNFGNIN